MAKHYFQLSKILKKLLYDHRMNPSDLANKVNLPIPTIHRLVTGKSTRPYRSSLEPIATYFSLTVDQLLGEQPLEDSAKPAPLDLSSRNIPIIHWDSAITHQKSRSKSTMNHGFLIASSSISEHCFAVIMNDSSMEPIFAKRSYLIIDPHKKPWDRSYALVQLKCNKTPIFRQVLIDGNDHYLKPLNPDLAQFRMKYFEPGDQILGVLIETRTNFSMPEQEETNHDKS